VLLHFYTMILHLCDWTLTIRKSGRIQRPHLSTSLTFCTKRQFAEHWSSPPVFDKTNERESAMASHRQFAPFALAVALISFLIISGCKTSPPSAPKDTPPTVSITSPQDGETSRLIDTVFVSASDDNAVTKVELYIDGALVSTDNAEPWRFIWNTTEWDDGPYTLSAIAYDGADHSTTSQSVTVTVKNEFPVTFYNTLYTTMNVTVLGVTQAISPDDSATFILSSNPGSLVYAASTSGKTSSGTTVGLTITWGGSNNPIDVSDYDSYRISFAYSSSYFFLYMKNSGNTTLGPLYVNYGLTSQTRDDISMPKNTSASYAIGYYHAYSNTEVRAYWAYPNDSYYTYWDQGNHFTFPGGTSQWVLLTNTFPTSKIVGAPAGNFSHTQGAPSHGVLDQLTAVKQTRTLHGLINYTAFADEP
jgi:hypothetical protein